MPGSGWHQLFSDLVKERCASVSELPILFNAFFRRQVAWRAVVDIRGMRWNSRSVLGSLACSGMSSWKLEAAGERAGTGTAMCVVTWSCIRVGRQKGQLVMWALVYCRGGYFGEKPRRIAGTRVRDGHFLTG